MCNKDNCNRVSRRKGLCGKHYAEYRGIVCSIDLCQEYAVGKGLCSLHWQRNKNGLDPYFKREVGKTYISSDGYVVEYKKDHVQSDKNGKVLQHRRVMSDMIGRKLFPYENVHHKNGNKQDNTPENLEIWVSKQPSGQRIEDLLQWAKWIIKEYDK